MCSLRSVEFCFLQRRKPSGCRDRPSGLVLHGVVGDARWGTLVGDVVRDLRSRFMYYALVELTR